MGNSVAQEKARVALEAIDPDALDAIPERTREQIASHIDDRLAKELGDSIDDVIAIIKSASDLTVIQQAKCPTCATAVNVRYPDYKGAKALLEFWVDRVLGRPTQRTESKKDVNVNVTGSLEDATDEQLRQIAASRKALPSASSEA